MAKDFEKELIELSTKTRSELKSIFKTDEVCSTEKLELLYVNAKDNAIGRYGKLLKDIEIVDPEKMKKIINQANKIYNSNATSASDVIDLAYDYLKYYHAITTEEQLRYEFERANRYVQYPGIDLPIVLEFDYQFYTRYSIFNLPTFYSYANTETITKFGKGAYHIAFPATQAHLTDDEVMVAMKHEFGHIFQGHTTVRFNDDEKFEQRNANAAMDISINIAMTLKEQKILFDLASKIWKNPNMCPCLSLSLPEGKGGYGIQQISSPTDWRGTLGILKAYKEMENEEGGDGGDDDGGDGTEGGGSGSSGGKGGKSGKGDDDANENPAPEKINVGDYVSIDGTDNYGKVISIGDDGRYVIDEISKEEWQNIKKSMR